MSKSAKVYQEPTRDEIAACAHHIYESQGRPEGKAVEHWLQAEAQLIAEHKAQAGQLPVKAAAKTSEVVAQTPSRNTWPAKTQPRQPLQHN